MGQKLNPPSLRLRRTSKKKATLESLAGTFDVLAEKMDKGFAGVDKKFEATDKKINALATTVNVLAVKVDNLAGTVDVLAKKMDQGFAAVDQRFDGLAFAVKSGFDEQGQRLDSLENRVGKVEDTLDNFWTHINILSGDVSKLKVSQGGNAGLG